MAWLGCRERIARSEFTCEQLETSDHESMVKGKRGFESKIVRG